MHDVGVIHSLQDCKFLFDGVSQDALAEHLAYSHLLDCAAHAGLDADRLMNRAEGARAEDFLKFVEVGDLFDLLDTLEVSEVQRLGLL